MIAFGNSLMKVADCLIGPATGMHTIWLSLETHRDGERETVSLHGQSLNLFDLDLLENS